MRNPLLVAALATLVLAGNASAQLRPVASSALLSAPARAELDGDIPQAGGSVLRRVLHAAAGAVVGAGIGYFASQVVYSDWDKSTNSTFADKRRAYALGGATVGAIVGVFIGQHKVAGRPPVGVAPVSRERGNVETISHEEIAGSGIATAYEIIQSLHPEWLVVRSSAPSQIRAYLNRAELGDIQTLRQVPAAELESILFLSPAVASFRLGSGHPQGAIIVQTRGSQ